MITLDQDRLKKKNRVDCHWESNPCRSPTWAIGVLTTLPDSFYIFSPAYSESNHLLCSPQGSRAILHCYWSYNGIGCVRLGPPIYI